MYKQLIFLTGLTFLITCCQQKPKVSSVEQVRQHVYTYTDSLHQSLSDLNEAVQSRRDQKELQQKFELARYHYKKLEPIIELYFPGFAEAINGPAIDEVEQYEDKVIEATGFQVVEEYLYQPIDTAEYEDLIQETKLLAAMTNRLDQLNKSNELTDEHVFQAARLELYRIISLGISGFDSPVALRSIPEATSALHGLKTILNFYAHDLNEDQTEIFDDANKKFSATIEYLKNNPDFNSFDRATFITKYINSLSSSIYAVQQALNISNRDFLTAVDLSKNNFFEPGAIQIKYFANPNNRDVTPEAVKLGQLLFFDPILSGNNKRSCASCHLPEKAFSDGRTRSLAFESNGVITRNAPSIINAAFQKMQFYDSRIMFQEDQVTDVMTNPNEMHGHIDDAVIKLKQSEEYKQHFKKAFGKEGDITNRKIQMALAAYIRSLSGLNSNFDMYMRGDKTKMNKEAINGFNLFMGKAKCGTCHFMPLFNGTVPPTFYKSESEVLGVPARPDTSQAKVDTDLGKFIVFKGDLNKHAFKTPTIRNAALTSPYMHNGVYPNLEDVLDFYNRGGGAGIGIDLPNQTLPADELNLSKDEQRDIIAFIHNLTDTTGLTTKPAHLPSFNKPHLDNRKVGGEY